MYIHITEPTPWVNILGRVMLITVIINVYTYILYIIYGIPCVSSVAVYMRLLINAAIVMCYDNCNGVSPRRYKASYNQLESVM